MKIIMTCGGTGGHIYPAIAIADKIKEMNPDAEILFIGTGRPLEKQLIPSAGYQLVFITASGFNRKNLLKNFRTFFDVIKGSREAAQIISEFRPDAVIGTGGYVCGPVIFEAHRAGIKTYLHEQNAAPGMTNKLLEPIVDRVFLGFPAAAQAFRNKGKLIISGNPVRKTFGTQNKSVARQQLGLDPNSFVILAFGGSQGAGMINKVMLESMPMIAGMDHAIVFFGTGDKYYDAVTADLKEMGLADLDNIKIMRYISSMEKYLAAADIAISRSGALTVAELAVTGTPAVLIPSPNVTGNHQFFNAKAVADHGGALIIEEKELDTVNLGSILYDLYKDPQKLAQMSSDMKKLGNLEAVDVIYENLELPEV